MISLSYILPWMLLLLTAPSSAAWLGVCPGTPQQADIKILDTLLKPAGTTASIVAADNRLPDCEMTELPLTVEQLRWSKMLNRREADVLSGGIIIKSARGESHTTAPQEIVPLQDDKPAPASTPLATELLAHLQATVFGAEARATVKQDAAGIRLDCAPGNAPAGALLGSAVGLRLPAGAVLALTLATETKGTFRVGVADTQREKIGESLTLGTINPGMPEAAFALPSTLDNTAWRFWVLECPASAARLAVRSMRLEARFSGPLPHRALWVWQPSAWQTNISATTTLLTEHGADTLFITVPLTAGNTTVAEPAALERFVAHASALGIKVWAVAGDPRAVLPKERDQFAVMARAYAAYNSTAARRGRLSGLQLDIEPYLNSGYQLDTEDWLAAYLDTLSRVRTQAKMPLDVAVPFWWGRQRYRNGLFLDHLGAHVEVVSVMNYRTDRQQLIDLAEPFLDWGTRAKKTIRIGIEAGPIPDESLHVFRNSTRGDLWLVPLGANTLILSLDAAQANPAGSAYAYSHTINRQGSDTTFRGNIRAMQKLLPELEMIWRAWPSFGGIALHGLDAD